MGKMFGLVMLLFSNIAFAADATWKIQSCRLLAAQNTKRVLYSSNWDTIKISKPVYNSYETCTIRLLNSKNGKSSSDHFVNENCSLDEKNRNVYSNFFRSGPLNPNYPTTGYSRSWGRTFKIYSDDSGHFVLEDKSYTSYDYPNSLQSDGEYFKQVCILN